jgi:hypothetical protein
MAWDAKQAADLLVMVRPEVLVVDLESPRDGCAIVAALATVDPVPHAVVVPGSTDVAKGLTAALADPAHAGRTMPRDRVLADVLKRTEAPPPERR